MSHEDDIGRAARIIDQHAFRTRPVTDAILRRHLKFTKEYWRQLDHNDLTLSADEALKIGLVHTIGEFRPPPGGKLYAVV